MLGAARPVGASAGQGLVLQQGAGKHVQDCLNRRQRSGLAAQGFDSAGSRAAAASLRAALVAGTPLLRTGWKEMAARAAAYAAAAARLAEESVRG